MEDEKQDLAELSDIEKSAIGEICDLITASLAKNFGDKLGSVIGMNPSRVEARELTEVAGIIMAPVLLMQLNCTSGLEGQFFLFISGEGLPKVFDLAIPDDAKEVGADDEVILEGIREIINSAVREAMANLADSMGYRIDFSVIDTIILQDESGFESIGFLYPEGKLLYVSTELDLPGGEVSAGYLLPVGLGKQIIDLLLNEQLAVGGGEAGDEESVVVDIGQDVGELPLVTNEEEDDTGADEAPRVRDMQLTQFNQPDEEADEDGANNIGLLLDVILEASIELGKTQMTIEDILKLGRGSVIELDKLASEPVEFLVNGKVIARGEVVVIDDNFGIRITEILSPKSRLEHI